MPVLNLNREARTLIAEALIAKANYIQTGTVYYSAIDAVAAGRSQLIKPLDAVQAALVLRLRNLAHKINVSTEVRVTHPALPEDPPPCT